MIKEMGFNQWFQDQVDFDRLMAGQVARVTAVNREMYTVSDGRKDVPAEITGKLMFSADSALDFPAVGDWVYVQLYNKATSAIIDEVLPRKSVLKRKTSGKKIAYQLIASNIDTGLIVQSLDANFNLRRLERYLVMIHDARIQPVVLLSKSDLLSRAAVGEKITRIHSLMPDATVAAFSNKDQAGMDTVQSLLNNLLGHDQFATRTIRDKDGKGRHTTTGRQLIRLPGGALIIDTPGMRELGNIAVEAGIEETFSEITRLANQCRFGDCSHTQEKGCAILAALSAGDISNERYESYMKLARESAFHEMSFLEKKQKDKAFGKMVKTVMKNKRNKR